MQQAQPAPLPPIPPIPPIPDISGGNGPGRFLTAREIGQIRQVRELLSDHLINIRGRREDVVENLRRSTGPERAGLEQHLGILDQRIVRIEGDLERTAQLLTTGMFGATEATTAAAPQTPFDNLGPDHITGIVIVFTLAVLMPIAIAVARLLWRRATAPRTSGPAWDSAQRVDRMEHAIDSIAVEVERISEGQRFVTRLLTESPNFGALNSGQRVGDAAAPREAVTVRRDEG